MALVLEDTNSFGKVILVDTSKVTVEVLDAERLQRLQVNRLAVLRCGVAGQHLVGIISKIVRKAYAEVEGEDGQLPDVILSNQVNVTLIGTLFSRRGALQNVFSRSIETVPEVDALCFDLEGPNLTFFMQVISGLRDDQTFLDLGHYTLDSSANAYLNGNKFFQRHALIVGGTGSGKSWTTARVLEQVAELPQANAILFDLHGEYSSLDGDGFQHLKIAGPADLETDNSLDQGVLYLPYWLLDYESMMSMFIDRSDQNAPNQAMLMSRTVIDAKRAQIEAQGAPEFLKNFTINSPIPFDLGDVKMALEHLNTEKVEGARANTEKQGDFFGKLSRLIGRLDAKIADRRLGFMFAPKAEMMEFEWLGRLVSQLMQPRGLQTGKRGGVKIINFSDVPSDILPIVTSMVSRLVFSVHQWSEKDKRHPIALICDEAHLYIPQATGSGSPEGLSVELFERIAKEGRKYGVGLVVVSQRPSEVSKTVLSQCGNVVAMRLTNGEDQAVISKLLPDNLVGFTAVLPSLDTGEALVVGDASLLPSRIRVSEPVHKPLSQSVEFWDVWSSDAATSDLDAALRSWRSQSFN